MKKELNPKKKYKNNKNIENNKKKINLKDLFIFIKMEK